MASGYCVRPGTQYLRHGAELYRTQLSQTLQDPADLPRPSAELSTWCSTSGLQVGHEGPVPLGPGGKGTKSPSAGQN